MQNLSSRISSVFKGIFVAGLFLSIISAVVYPNISIDSRVFLLPTLFLIPVFISIFFLFSVPSLQGNATIYVRRWKKALLSLLIFAVTTFMIYLSIYIPLTSRLVAEIPITQAVQQQQILFISGGNYYADIYASRGRNVEIKISVANQSWSDQTQIPIYRSSKSQSTLYSVFGSEKLPFVFPETGVYTTTITLEGDSASIRKIKIFERI